MPGKPVPKPPVADAAVDEYEPSQQPESSGRIPQSLEQLAQDPPEAAPEDNQGRFQ
jgi:hypothetical protein